MSSVPEDLYRDILVNLPVKSLLACKCVCKIWYALISNPSFVKLHHDLTVQKGNPSVVLQGHSEIGRYEVFYLINHDSLESLLSTTDDFIEYAVELDYPFNSLFPTTDDCIANAVELDYPSKVVCLVGCCNGLVCLLLGLFYNDTDTVGESFCLWNPATKEHKELPKPPDVDDTFGIWVSGFAYDKSRGDYNVINCYDHIVQVYSLELNSWKIIHIRVPLSPQRTFGSLEAGVFFNEEFHWLHGGKVEVLSLDLSNERINEIQIPVRFSIVDFDLYLMLAVLEGCLCLIKSHLLIVGVEVWVMQDYGVQKTWTKSFIINNESNGFMRRVWSSKKGEILIEIDGYQVLYNHKFGTVRKQNNQSLIGTRTRGENYFESLVSLNAGTYVQEKKQKQRKLMTRI